MAAAGRGLNRQGQRSSSIKRDYRLGGGPAMYAVTAKFDNIGDLKAGSAINLERAVTPATRLGGHIVQGHVDARGKFLGFESHGESWTFRIAYPKEIARYLVFKGSVAVEGISLTIANLTDEYFEIAVIPKTWEATNFSQLKPSDEVNLEVDVIAKYVERILSVRNAGSESPNPLPAR